MKKLLVWGAGDQGIVTLECALAMNKYNEFCFVKIDGKKSRPITGYDIYNEEQLSTIIDNFDEVIVAVGDNQIRKEKLSLLKKWNTKITTIIHPSAIISPTAKVEEGTIIGASVVINAFAQIKRGCILNTGTIIEHDCLVEEFVNICPKVVMAGHVRIGKECFLGTGCNIIPNVCIGKRTIIGAGAVVIKDIASYQTAIGVPAKIK